MSRLWRLVLVVVLLPVLLLASVPVVFVVRFAGVGYLLAVVVVAALVAAFVVLRRRSHRSAVEVSEGSDRYSSLETL